MEALRRRFPLAAISALVTPQSAAVLEGQGLVDDLILLDKYVFDSPGGFAQLKSVTGLASLSRRLRARSFDAVVLLHHLVTWSGVAKYAALTRATGAKTIAGLDDGRGRFLSLAARDAGFGSKHEVEYWLDVVSLLGADLPMPMVKLRWGTAEEGYADSVWKSLGLAPGEPVVAIHPGTGSYSPTRRWAPERFSEVGRALAGDGFTPVLVAGPGEEDLAGQVAAELPRPLVLSGAPTPRHLAAFLGRCRLLVGNDSGVSHVGAAAGVPVVAVFGPSNHRAWAPYDPTGRGVRVVRADLPCGPCLYRGQSLGMRNGCGDPRCLDLIGVEPVLRAVREMVSRGSKTC
jgi:heptosyltransferase-2